MINVLITNSEWDKMHEGMTMVFLVITLFVCLCLLIFTVIKIILIKQQWYDHLALASVRGKKKHQIAISLPQRKKYPCLSCNLSKEINRWCTQWYFVKVVCLCLTDGVHPTDAAGAPCPGTWSLAISACPWGCCSCIHCWHPTVSQLYLPLPTSFRIASISIHCFRVLVLSSLTQWQWEVNAIVKATTLLMSF